MRPRYSIRHTFMGRWHCGQDGKRLVTEDINLVLDTYLELQQKGIKGMEIVRLEDDEEQRAD